MKPRHKKLYNTLLFVVMDALFVALSAFFTVVLIEGGIRGIGVHHLIWFGVNEVAAIAFLFAFGVYRVAIKSVSVVDALRMVAAIIAVFAVNVVFCIIDGPIGIPHIVVYCLLLLLCVGGERFFLRIIRSLKVAFRLTASEDAVRTLIVGAGRSGDALIREMQSSDKITYFPVCLVDDDETKLGTTVCEVKVLGTSKDIPEICKKYDIEEIIIAMPSSSKKDIKRIVDICANTSCKVKTLPGIYQLVNGEVTVGAIRSVDISDLLGRDQVKVDLDEIMHYIESEKVLVTGGGGSIGSELCRQIATHNPKQLIILDIYAHHVSLDEYVDLKLSL